MSTPSSELLALIERAAELRALGKSWETIAAQVGRSARTARGWPRAHPEAWRKAFRDAEAQMVLEATAEAILVLRELLRSKEDKGRQDAARQLLGFRKELLKIEGKVVAEKKPLDPEAKGIAEFLSSRDDGQVKGLIDDLLRQAPPEETSSSPLNRPGK